MTCSTASACGAYREQHDRGLPGGVRKLVDIAMAVTHQPKLLLLDEPTSGVAVEEKFPLMDVIMRALEGSDATVLFVEHDMDIVGRYADRVLAFYERPHHRRRHAGRGARQRRGAALRHRRCARERCCKSTRCASSCSRCEVLRGISLDAARPARWSASSAATAPARPRPLRAVMGLVGASGGRISFDGEDLIALPTHRRAALGIGYMPEDRRPRAAALGRGKHSAAELGHARRSTRASRLDFVYGLMPEVAAMRERKALALSGGQQKLVALARALIVGTRLLLLDEPFEGVAPALSRRLAEVIGMLRGKDCRRADRAIRPQSLGQAARSRVCDRARRQSRVAGALAHVAR